MNNLRVEKIKSEVTPRTFYERKINNLKISNPNGWCMAGLCPFHADKREGSFWVNVENGAYKCHSCGASGGDIIQYQRCSEKVSFAEALTRLEKEFLL